MTFLSFDKKVVEISDLYTEEKYRNQSYCKLLLLNVFYYFGEKEYIVNVDTWNKPAFKCCEYIFGKPKQIIPKYTEEFLAHFDFIPQIVVSKS